jgi:hypothetical protein
MQEEWRPIKSYEGCYEVSNLGRVRSVTRKIERTDPKNISKTRLFTYKGKLIPFWINEKGYLRLTLNKDGNKSNHLVHRLVANSFLDNIENKNQVNHKNGIKSDNRVDNLEWVTNLENRLHSYYKLGNKIHKPKNVII